MPRFRRRRFRKRRHTHRKKKKLSKSVGAKLLRNARKRGTNSRLEKAVELIAKKQAMKLLPPPLIFRREIYGTYDRDLNVFGPGTALSMTGLIVHMCQIPITDDSTNPVQNPQPDPAFPTQPNYNRGTNVIAVNQRADGYRQGSVITVTSLGCDLRFTLKATEENVPRKECVFIEYAIVLVNHPDSSLLQWKPDVDQILPFKGIGYSSRIDTAIRSDKTDLKQRILKRGRVKMNYREWLNNEKYVKLFWSGKLRYEYDTRDGGQFSQNGQRVTSTWKAFLVMRSDVPTATTADEIPDVSGFMKVGYKDLS